MHKLQQIKELTQELFGIIAFDCLDDYLNQYSYIDDEKHDIYSASFDKCIDQIGQKAFTNFDQTVYDIVREKIQNKEYSLLLAGYINDIKNFPNKELLDYVITSAGGDDYDGFFTPRGEIEFYEAKKELDRRLKEIGFYG